MISFGPGHGEASVPQRFTIRAAGGTTDATHRNKSVFEICALLPESEAQETKAGK